MDALFKQYNYPPANKFYQILKGNNIKATHNQVKEFIEKQAISQVHKNRKSKKQVWTFYRKYSEWNIPNRFVRLPEISAANKGYNWNLICIDVFARKAFSKPVKDKAAGMVKEAFVAMKEVPEVVFHDEGNEFKGSSLQYLKEKDIIHVENGNGTYNAFGIADRFSRTITTEISKYMTASNTTKWCRELPRLVDLYNNIIYSYRRHQT